MLAKIVRLSLTVSPGILCVYIEKNDDFSWFMIEILMHLFCNVAWELFEDGRNTTQHLTKKKMT